MKTTCKPIVYLVGAGPGDEGLITVRGRDLIENADCIVYDYLVNPEILKARKPGSKLIYVGKKAGAHTLPQASINRLLVKEAKACKNVVRLKGGDPFIFGRGAEEAVYLRKNKIAFEIVPGITSAIAVPAYAGIPLTERGKTSTVGFITGHEDPTKAEPSIDWNAITKALGTMVFLMGAGNLGLIARKLMASGKPKSTPAAIIRWGTTTRQKAVTGTLNNIAELAIKNKISSPAIIVVGETVGFRDKLSWFEDRPLFAKKAIVTRTRRQASVLTEKLKGLGADVVEMPTIETVSLDADAALRKAFLGQKHDWVFFTSQNGVEEFSRFLKANRKDVRIFGPSKVCAIGPETASALRRIGINPDYVPPKFIAEEIVKHFKRLGSKAHGKIGALILRGKKARDILPEGLKRIGFRVETIDLYDTAAPKGSAQELKAALAGGVDFITFTSSSTAENFVRLLGKDYKRRLSGVKLVSIGPITSKTIRGFGLKVAAEAKVYTIDGLVAAILQHRR